MKRKSIVIDMDDVITSGGLLYLINEYMHTNYKEADFKDFYMQDIVDDKQKFFDFFLKHNQYDYVSINNNAKKIIKELCDKYEVFIGTSYIFREIVNDSGIFVKYKYDYLIKNFPFVNPMNFVFLGNKSILKSDVKIDDKLENLTNAKIKLLYTAYHNKDLSDSYLKSKGIIRVNNWIEIENVLLERNVK